MFASFPDPTAHYGVFKAPNIIRSTIQAFIENRFTTDLPGISGAGASGGGGKAPAADAKPSGLAK
jgi:hypothetical protein